MRQMRHLAKGARNLTGSLALGGALLPLAAGLSCQPGPQGGAFVLEERVESGFVMGRDSFSFENYGGEKRYSVITEASLVRMFGTEKVCAEVGADGACRLKRAALAWQDKVNKAMKAGRCEGFAVLSSLMSAGLVDPNAFGAPEPIHSRTHIFANIPAVP